MRAINGWRNTSAVKDSRGQAMVEAAMTMLLFFIFLFAVFEAGRLLQVRQTLTDAAREGARRSVAPMTHTLPGDLPDPDDVKGVVQSYLQASSIHIPSADITVDQNVDIGGTKYSRVTVTYSYFPVSLAGLSSLNLTLTGQSLMRNETSP